MRRKILVDTNILLDAAMVERPESIFASMLLEEVAYKEVQAFTPASSLKDVYYVLTHYWDEPSAREYISALMDLFQLVAVDEAVCRQAARSDEPDYEDGVVRVCADNEMVHFIISRDEKAFQKSQCRKYSAKEYMLLYGEIEEISV